MEKNTTTALKTKKLVADNFTGIYTIRVYNTAQSQTNNRKKTFVR
jgi:hypothetical protein